MKRDRLSTVTGYVWLDWLTHPFWVVYCWASEWLFFRHVGGGDAARGRRVIREAAAYDPIDEAIRELFESYER